LRTGLYIYRHGFVFHNLTFGTTGTLSFNYFGGKRPVVAIGFHLSPRAAGTIWTRASQLARAYQKVYGKTLGGISFQHVERIL